MIRKGTFWPEHLGNKKNVYCFSFWPKKVLMYPVETEKKNGQLLFTKLVDLLD